MCLARGPQRSDACEARTLKISFRAVYRWIYGRKFGFTATSLIQ